jgi:uncharacterized coiled-coil protein SlyX
LEERLAWYEHHATQQDKVMLELAEEVACLRKELLGLRGRIAQALDDPSENVARDERPPHY